MLETGPWPRRTFDAELGQVLAVGHLERRRADSAAIAGLLAHGASQQGRDEAPEEEVRRCYRWRYVSHGLPLSFFLFRLVKGAVPLRAASAGRFPGSSRLHVEPLKQLSREREKKTSFDLTAFE